jgi:hypothetical protein
VALIYDDGLIWEPRLNQHANRRLLTRTCRFVWRLKSSDGDDSGNLLKNADPALYRARADGEAMQAARSRQINAMSV